MEEIKRAISMKLYSRYGKVSKFSIPCYAGSAPVTERGVRMRQGTVTRHEAIKEWNQLKGEIWEMEHSKMEKGRASHTFKTIARFKPQRVEEGKWSTPSVTRYSPNYEFLMPRPKSVLLNKRTVRPKVPRTKTPSCMTGKSCAKLMKTQNTARSTRNGFPRSQTATKERPSSQTIDRPVQIIHEDVKPEVRGGKITFTSSQRPD